MTREEAIKAGRPERVDWPGNRLQLSWEVWGERRPLRPMFIIDHESHDGALSKKQAYDTFEDAVTYFDEMVRLHAVEIAVAALRVRKRLH